MQLISRKDTLRSVPISGRDNEGFSERIKDYLDSAIRGVRSDDVVKKVELHLGRFREFFLNRYGHDRIVACIKRDVIDWRSSLIDSGFAPATINNHLASLSGFFSELKTSGFIEQNPCKDISELALPPLEPRALDQDQVRSLKNICDRLKWLYVLKARRVDGYGKDSLVHSMKRPYRDRAIIFVLLSTGLRREELVNLRLTQIVPGGIVELRKAKKAKFKNVKGKGKTERVVFLSADARDALADYLEFERIVDAGEDSERIFLSAKKIPKRLPDGRMTPRSINFILERIGQLHDGEFPKRKISPLRPHDLRHTFAFLLAEATGKDSYELQRRLGHRSKRYIERYTNPPEEVAAGYIEKF